MKYDNLHIYKPCLFWFACTVEFCFFARRLGRSREMVCRLYPVHTHTHTHTHTTNNCQTTDFGLSQIKKSWQTTISGVVQWRKVHRCDEKNL